jgi:hypothetical protein
MKYAHFHDYHHDDTARSESALLSIWPRLADFHEDLVLVGGLVPRYLCRVLEEEWQPRTIDVDFAIGLAAGGSMYEPLSNRLTSEGFVQKGARFEKALPSATLYVDFLTERPSSGAPHSAQVDDIAASAFFGIDRALKIYREVRIEGKDLSGANVREIVKVCEIGPFLCLKLQAYAKRAEPKDVFDAVHAVLAYDLGVGAAEEGFHRESGLNLAYPVAKQVLEERFGEEREKGPSDYANFCLGGLDASLDEDADFRRSTLAADAVTVARCLSK